MPEYSSTTITPADGVKTPAMNGSTSGNYTLSALRDFILASKGQANGLASLDANGKLLSSQLPDLADDVIVVASYATLPATGTAGKLYITADNNKMYRWDPDLATPDYVELSVDLSAYATIADLQDGTLEPLISTKARQDKNGNVIDQTYETKAEASELKGAISFNRKRIENLEQKSGSVVDVDYPDYSVYGEVPTGKAKNAIVSKLRGVTVAYNNGVTNGNFVNNTDGWTIQGTLSASGNVGTFTPSWAGAQLKNSCAYLANNHYHLITFRAKATGMQFACAVPTTGINWNIPTSVTVLTTYAKIVQSTEARNLYFYVDGSASGASLELADVESHDLTQMFGSYVANYLYSIEQGTAGAGVALFRALVSAQDNSYETVRLVSTTYSAVKSKSRNVWDEQTKEGFYAGSNGSYVSNNSELCSKNPIPVIGGATYYYTSPYAITVRFYDASMGYLEPASPTRNDTFVVPPSASFMHINLTTSYGTTYNHNICINLTDSQDGTYTSYSTPKTLTLPESVTLRGILKVVNNALTVDGDEYDPETGDIDRNYGIVTFDGSDDEGWYKSSNVFISSGIDVSDALSTNWWSPFLAENNLLSRGVCVDYNQYGTLPFAITMVGGNIRLHITECENMTEAEFKTWLSNNNIQLLYKKASPTSDPNPVTPINDPTLATEGGGSLSTTQTNDPAIVSAMQISYLTL